MSTNRPAKPMTQPFPRIAPEEGAVKILLDRVAELEGSLERIVSATRERIAELEDRVDALEARPGNRTGPRDLDETSKVIKRFLEEHYPLKFTALTLAENIGNGLDNERLGSRLQTMLRRGDVVIHQRDGKTATWTAVPPKTEVTSDER